MRVTTLLVCNVPSWALVCIPQMLIACWLGSSWGDCMFSCLCKHKLAHQEVNIGGSSCEQEFKMLCWPLLTLGGVLEAMTEDIGVLMHWLSSWQRG